MLRFFRRIFSKDKHYYRFIWQTFHLVPNNIELYKLALVHRSASIALGNRKVVNNERLEFLGDAVIDTIVTEMLFIDYPNLDEGELTQLRSRIVNRDTLNHLALTIKLDQELIANPVGLNNHKASLYGDALEALFGAVYLDKGYNYANRTFILLLEKHLDIDQIYQTEQDFKSRIIEWGQKHQISVVFQSKPSKNFDETNPAFEATLCVDGKAVSKGVARSKKIAEQRAAQEFYENNGDFSS